MKNMVFSPPQAKNRPESGVSEHRVSELAPPPPSLSGQIGDADPLCDLDHPNQTPDPEALIQSARSRSEQSSLRQSPIVGTFDAGTAESSCFLDSVL